MELKSSSYSPNIRIYLQVEHQRIRLADVLYDTAKLYEKAEIAPGTKASLVFSIDGDEHSEEVILNKGISLDASLISFQYADPNKLNSRHFERSF